MRRFAILFAVVVYFAGCNHLNGEVREACTHGNCVHGWYSKYNTSEKLIARSWMFGYPIVALIFWGLFVSPSEPLASSNEESAKVNASPTDPPKAESESRSDLANASGPIAKVSGVQKVVSTEFSQFAEAALHAKNVAKANHCASKVVRTDSGWKVVLDSEDLPFVFELVRDEGLSIAPHT